MLGNWITDETGQRAWHQEIDLTTLSVDVWSYRREEQGWKCVRVWNVKDVTEAPDDALELFALMRAQGIKLNEKS
jgi:hypothetical protein